ncbi:hypothetical protein P691DRAFT_844513 [Macrolepiota fuliginosa MF-IS2]|uniref:Uncharacterized protein n=1 Tax=Macrolepiota fuliginosa MF-IS2 TaxID=1400762 RepID=A0A9P5X2U7_9AGAR|nr:hypothetical protein P691DRAFT_844513 [Macrolepiota fuliginosa MF-IS2]
MEGAEYTHSLEIEDMEIWKMKPRSGDVVDVCGAGKAIKRLSLRNDLESTIAFAVGKSSGEYSRWRNVGARMSDRKIKDDVYPLKRQRFGKWTGVNADFNAGPSGWGGNNGMVPEAGHEKEIIRASSKVINVGSQPGRDKGISDRTSLGKEPIDILH